MKICFIFFFFFSSRRRHTRLVSDWSSDVCSSDLELRGAELIAAAEAHDALFSFDSRARAAALEVGLPLMPEGEILFVNVDPRAVLDVESSMRTTWPIVIRLGADPGRICLELIRPERSP